MSIHFEDYYKLLDVPRTATQAEIQKAYRKLARKYHPDVNKEKGAEDKFKKVSEAYEVLKNPETRTRYDGLGANWKAGENFTPPSGFDQFGFEFGGFGGQNRNSGFSQFFDTIFGSMGQQQRPRRPAPQPQRDLDFEISLEDAYHKATKSIILESPTGSKKFDVTIPAGVSNGTRIRLANPGNQQDLYLRIIIKPHPRFKPEGPNLKTYVWLSPWEAALGAKVPVVTIDGEITMKIPAGTQSGTFMRAKGKGLPQSSSTRGDLLVEAKIVVPTTLSEQEHDLLTQLSKVSTFDPRKH